MNAQSMNSESTHNDITRLLRKHGVSPTTQRLQIASILLSKYQHLSADQVLKAVNEHYTIVSKATVYNTLNLFAEKGLVRQVIVDPNKVFYDSNVRDHYHIYNEESGELIDIEPGQLEISGMPELPVNTVECGIDVIVKVRNKQREAVSHKS